MGYGLMVYRVDAAKVTSLIGSKDAALLTQITGWTLADFAAEEHTRASGNNKLDDDDFVEDYEQDPAWAIRDFIMGREMTLSGAEYGYGYKALIASLGESLSNTLFYPAGERFFQSEIDPELKAAGALLQVEDLIFGSALVQFPRPEDFPGFGYWSAEEVAASVAPLQAYSGTRPEIAAICEWCEAAAPSGETIVGFYH